MPGFLQGKKSSNWPCSWLCTASLISSCVLKFFTPRASLRDPNTWYAHGLRLGEYVGCGRHFKSRFIIWWGVACVMWGCTLSCWNSKLELSKPDVLNWFQVLDCSLEDHSNLRSWYWFLCACIVPGLSLYRPRRGLASSFRQIEIFGFGKKQCLHFLLARFVSCWK